MAGQIKRNYALTFSTDHFYLGDKNQTTCYILMEFCPKSVLDIMKQKTNGLDEQTVRAHL
jgi:hypothetical protein